MADSGARVYRDSTQSLATGDNALSFTAVRWDTDGFFSPGAPSRLTIPAGQAGYYYAWAGANLHYPGVHPWLPNRWLGIRRSGATWLFANYCGDNTSPQAFSVGGVCRLEVGDYVEAVARVQQPSEAWAEANSAIEFAVQRLSTESQASVRVRRSSAQTIPPSTWTVVEFNDERWDSHGFHDNDVNPSRLTAPAGMGGKYLIGACVTYTQNIVTTWLSYQIRVNGTPVAHKTRVRAYADYGVVVETVYHLDPGDYAETWVYQGTVGDIYLAVIPAYSPEMWMVRLD